jgi:hypothetical protein
MAEQLNWKCTVQVAGGPAIAAAGTQIVDAYSKSQVVVPGGTTSTPGTIVLNLDLTGASILIVRASRYVDPENPDQKLQYTVTDGGAAGTATDLQGPIFMIGETTVRLLGDSVESLTFANSMTTEVTIDTLVGLDATPTP